MDNPRQDDLQERLEQMEAALETSERHATASQYASAIMHEVNNPLEAITNLVYLTKAECKSPARVLEYMAIVEDQLRVLTGVTGEALAFHRRETEAREFDMVHIAEAALKLHANKFVRHNTSVARRFRGSAIALMRGSDVLQVVSNLILNAVEAAPEEGGRLWIGASRDHKAVHLTVADDGPGIPKHLIPRLFNSYVTSKERGTGLGLWLSRRIITKHGGTIRFRTSNAGTIFRITLPVAKAHETTTAA